MGESLAPCVLRSTAVSPQSSWSKNVIQSRTTQGYLSNEVNKCQGASWSEKRDDKELRGALGGKRNLELRGCAVSWNIVDLPSPRQSTTVCYANFRGCVWLIHCSAVLFLLRLSLMFSVMRFRNFAS